MITPSVFPIVASPIDQRGTAEQANQKAWEPVLERFEAALKEVTAEGTAHACQRHQLRGQLLARDRISLLLDSGSAFLELGTFAGYALQDSSLCASLIAGIGSVCGRHVLILSHIPTQSGGAWNEMTGMMTALVGAITILKARSHNLLVVKQNRITEIANENNLPIIALIQSAGVFLPQQFRVFHKGGQIFRDLAIRSRERQPTCGVVFGSSTAGGAYHPALSDYTIFVQGQAQVFLGGPPLVKMATGEIIDAETLGGALTHATVTGLADQIALDEFDAIRKAREWVGTLSQNPTRLIIHDAIPLAPCYPAEDLLSIVNPDIRKPFNMLAVLLRIVDGSRMSIFKPKFGPSLLTAWAQIMGHTVGIVANQVPILNPDEASKGAQFIRICNQQNTPIIFFHNVTGFMVGSKAEHAAIIKKGAQMVSAVSCSTVPHISIIIGASYGAGNYAMCGRAYKPRFLFTWPTGRCSVMGPEQLAGVMRAVETSSANAKGVTLPPEELDARVQRFHDSVARDSEAYRTSGVMLDDGIIDPRDTRDVLGMCLEVVTLQDVHGAESHQVLARL